MDVVGERLHVGKLAVGMDDALRVALALPGVVDVDVDVAGIAHAGGNHGVGGWRGRRRRSPCRRRWFQLFQPMGGVAASVVDWADAARVM